MLSFFPRGVLDETLNLIETVSKDFPSYSYLVLNYKTELYRKHNGQLYSHIQLWFRLTGELSFLIGEKIDRGLASLRSPIRF